MIKRFYLILFAIGMALTCWAQATSLHLDKPYYFSGEHIFYSFCNFSLSSESASARVELYDNDRVIASSYLTILDQCGAGYIKLPYEVRSGMYQLAITVHTQVSFEAKELSHISVPIYNGADIQSLDLLVAERPALSDMTSATTASMVTEEAIHLSVQVPSELIGNIKHISVSVRDHQLFGGHLNTVHQTSSSDLSGALIKGVPFFGVRTLTETESITSKLLFAYNAENMVFDATEVDEASEAFNFEISPFFNKQPISFHDLLLNDIQISARPKDIRPNVEASVAIDSQIVEHLAIYQEEKQINRVFKQFPLAVESDSSIVQSSRLTPNYSVDVQDYTIRGTSVDLFKELISSPLKFRSIGRGAHRARVFYERNGLTKFYSRPPLFVVNNGATRDGAFVAKFPLQEIADFHVYSLYDALGKISPMAFGGIVYVDMMDPNYAIPDAQALPTLTLQGMQEPLQYPIVPLHRVQAPSIGSLLYWNPSISLQGASVQIDFKANDIATDYILEIVLHLDGGKDVEVIRQIVTVETP